MEAREIWNKYEQCRDYLDRKNLVSNTNKYWNFYLGNQWVGCQTDGEELPFMNVIKPIAKYKIATVCQNNTVVNYSDANGNTEMEDVYRNLNQMFSALWEKAGMDTNVWKVVKDAYIAGDSYAYFGTADVRDMQILSNMAVLLGDEQNPNIQEQPFIIIRERLQVRRLKEIARKNGIPESDVSLISADEDTDYLVSNKEDVMKQGDDGKTTSLLYMTKINGIVNVAKCVQQCIYQPLAPVQAKNSTGEPSKGLTLYPIVNFVWEDAPNNARGQGEVKELIPNQLEINKTLARISMCVKTTAFPRIAYDKNAIQNPDQLDKVGGAIEVNGGGAQSINQMISYLQSAPMSSDARVFLTDMMDQTRELSGASDTALGQISDPTRVAASAIIAIKDQSALPLNEQVAKFKKFTEDVARLWPEIWFTYNPDGMTVSYEEQVGPAESQLMTAVITKEDIERIMPDIRVDVSQDTPWTKNAEQQTVDGLLERNLITFEEYADLSVDNGPVPKSKLQKVINKRKVEAQLAAEQQAIIEAQAAAQQTMGMKEGDNNAMS